MWQKLGLIAEGGSVFDIQTDQIGETWLATGAGILHQTKQDWEPILQSQPLPSIVTLCSDPSGKNRWAAGLSGDLVRTRNGGQSWELCWLDQIDEPVICFAVSPRYRADSTLLAGTNGSGILRSTDGGRRWLLSNFGLQDFTILALTTATDWTRREVVFAGTQAGVYRSSGGGRAWKQVGLENIAIQALAVSNQFVENGLILAGSDGNGIYRSADGGKSWQLVEGGLAPDCTVNTFLVYQRDSQECWLAGTDDHCLWQSVDEGQTWIKVLTADQPVLVLAEDTDTLFAGLSDSGLLTSTDDGHSWAASTPLFGRGWQRLITFADNQLLAVAPYDGAWSSIDEGQTWERRVEASLDLPVFGVAVLKEVWLTARLDGLWRKVGDGVQQQVLIPGKAPIVALAIDSPSHSILAAATDCMLWRSVDAGITWQSVETPFVGQQLLALALVPEDLTVLVCSLAPLTKKLTLWRMLDGNTNWEVWLHRPIKEPFAQVIARGRQAEGSILIIDKEIWRYSSGEWQKYKTFDQTIRRVTSNLTDDLLYVLVGEEIHSSKDGLDWISMTLPQEAGPLVDLQVVARDKLLALDIKGVLWQASNGK